MTRGVAPIGLLTLSALLLSSGYLFTVSASAHAANAATVCDNFFGRRCSIDLTTGVHMSYVEVGRQSIEPLILLHTDTTSSIEWAWTVEALLRLNPSLHVIALDQRGAGTTELPDTALCEATPNLCMTSRNLAADLLAFMDARHIAKATLVGHAMGAAAARSLALEHPERVSRMILSGIGVAPHAQEPKLPRLAYHALDSLGWQAMLEARHVPWPEGALHLRPLDIDPDAVRHLTQHWDISAIAAPEVVAAIAAQSAMQSLATWGVIDPTPVPPEAVFPWNRLSVPTLVLWGSEDAGLDHASQDSMIELLRKAGHTYPGMVFYWKQYGVRPPPRSGDKHDADDIGHNLSWEAPAELAADIDNFVRIGQPTRDLYRSDAPNNIRRILVEPGKAIIKTSRP